MGWPKEMSGGWITGFTGAAQASPRDHLPAPHRESPTPRCLLIQSGVCAVVVVVSEVTHA